MEQPNQFWKAKVKEIDLTLPRNSSIMKKVDSIFNEGLAALQKKGSKFESTVAKVQTLLKKYYPIPPDTLKELIPSNSTDFDLDLHNPTNEKNYLTACRLFNLDINNYSFEDFERMYFKRTPVFYANNIYPFEYYHDLDTSVKYLDKLLLHQNHDSIECVAEFLQNLRWWFDREGWGRNPKMNAVCIIGPPNSGKKYFFDALVAIACNVGHIGRVNNKTNQFALQDAYNRRIVVGNEISMEDGAEEDFKKLCEGTAFNIRVKYQGDKIFNKTPVLLISNFILDIYNDIHFKNVRLKTIRWSTAKLLKDSTKQPYPLAIFKLFNKYGVN